MTDHPFLVIRTEGTPAECGRQYGAQAESHIRRSLTAYQGIFAHYTGWSWSQVQAKANEHKEAIAGFAPHLLEEMEAIAQGAGVVFADILALNVRTEILNAAIARGRAAECTAFFAPPAITASGHTLIGQNWDWKPAVRDSVVLLEAAPVDRPKFITLVEAGLLAKTGMNGAGIGLATNALVSDMDTGAAQIPYHVLLRAILEAPTFDAAQEVLDRETYASAANYLIAHRDGSAVNLEALPGERAQVFRTTVSNNGYAHTNHYTCTDPREFTDVGLEQGPDSPVRLSRMQAALRQHSQALAVADLKSALADHFNYPFSVCSHPDQTKPEPEQYASLASVIMDLNTATLWLAKGYPCEASYIRREYGEWFEGGTSPG